MAITALIYEQVDAFVDGIGPALIGDSAPMVALRQMIARVARSSASVMITGPSGSGKEVVARSIHSAGLRHSMPFVALNCGAVPTELIESELFGHERGAFTGAQARRIGHFEHANNGTLFLDEIGDMRFDMQVKLLRVLEDGLVSRIGGNGSLPVDVRIICATHQDLHQAIQQHRFREDLFFRLGVLVLDVPALASRAEDVPALIEHFQRSRPAGPLCRFDASAKRRLMAHNWPGNVRELRNLVERAAVLHGGECLNADDVERLLGQGSTKMLPSADHFNVLANQAGRRAAAPPSCPIDLKTQVERLEMDRIEGALDQAHGIIAEAARSLGLKRTTLIEKMRKYGVKRLA